MTYQRREIVSRLARSLREMPVVVLTGMRQTGKTTLLQQDPALRGRSYVSLDDFATYEAAKRNPEALVEGDGPITIGGEKQGHSTFPSPTTAFRPMAKSAG
jgi:predicted AAA+ superfamily ATPase